MEKQIIEFRTVRLLMPVKKRFDRILAVEKQYRKERLTASDFISELLEAWEKENTEKAEKAESLKIGS